MQKFELSTAFKNVPETSIDYIQNQVFSDDPGGLRDGLSAMTVNILHYKHDPALYVNMMDRLTNPHAAPFPSIRADTMSWAGVIIREHAALNVSAPHEPFTDILNRALHSDPDTHPQEAAVEAVTIALSTRDGLFPVFKSGLMSLWDRDDLDPQIQQAIHTLIETYGDISSLPQLDADDCSVPEPSS